MRTSDIARPLTAQALNENLYKQFNVKINFDKYNREQLENYRNLLRSKVHATETTANFNDLLTNETYQKDKYMLSVLNTKIKEMLGEGKKSAKPDFLDMDKDGNKKEPMKKAVADKKKNPFKKTDEAQTMSRAAKGNEKYGKDGMKALAKAGKEGKDLDKIRNKYDKYDESAKPDFLDMDKDGDKKEPMKKAVADKKKNPFKKTTEATKPLKGGQKKLDTDKDGDIDAKDMKNLRSKKKVKESSELLHKAYQQFIAEGIANYIAEDEEGKAKSITAAADMVNDFTSWMQRVGNYQTKSMIELADNIRANFGMQEAETFKQSVGSALEGALNALTTAREEINNAVAVLAGEAPAAEPMGMEPDVGDTGMEDPGMEAGGPDEMNMPGDEFAAADAAAGGETDLGRMKRESIERGNRLMKILGS